MMKPLAVLGLVLIVLGLAGLALGLLGDGAPPAQLAAANVVLVMVYQIGSTAGPTLSGTAMDLIGPEGLVVVVALAAAGLLVAFFRIGRS